MARTEARQRPSLATRRAGYVVGVVVNLILLSLVNVWPGWDAVPFLTAEAALVIGLVNASIVVNLVANLVYLVTDPPWVRSLGDLLTAVVGLVAMVRIWQVFPFDFSGYSVDWSVPVRVLLVVGIVGSAIAIIAALVTLLLGARDAVAGSPRPGSSASDRTPHGAGA